MHSPQIPTFGYPTIKGNNAANIVASEPSTGMSSFNQINLLKLDGEIRKDDTGLFS
tara:strand:+ start:233 stop:400 length:168 start_codon:yes stop_codon:yes gene_type:complete